MELVRGGSYSRADVKEMAGLPRGSKGGNWDTGIVEHAAEFLIFANIGTEGRTGHDYGNRWEGSNLRWYHKAGSHLFWHSVQRLLEPGRTIYVFWRTANKAPFIYAGTAAVRELIDSSPVEILWDFEGSSAESGLFIEEPEQLPRGEFREGGVRQVLVNAYERSQAARQVCIEHYGLACVVCGFDFEKRYGSLGAGFIHVHHVVPLSEIGDEYELNPIADLRPVCPNCHAMLHRQRPSLAIEELRAVVALSKAGSY